MKKYKYVIFDLDGTLMDTSDGIIKSVEYTIKTLGYPWLPKETLRLFIGPPIVDSLKEKYSLSDDEARYATKVFRDAYKNIFLFDARVYQGVPFLLEKLHEAGIKIAVATYKRDDYAKQLLDHFDLLNTFNYVMGADEENLLKKSDIICICMDKLGCSNYQDVVLVGDTKHDAVASQQLGIDFIAVTYGFGFVNEADAKKFNSDFVCSNSTELAAILLGSDCEHN